MEDGPEDVTELLARLSSGQNEVSARVIALVYAQLRQLAGRCMRGERPSHTLQATALVNEAYLKLIGQRDVHWQSRSHFFAIAAQVMRRILLDYAREHRAFKRGGDKFRVTLDDGLLIQEDRLESILILDESLGRLAAIDPEQSRLVELRFFAGLTVEETAEVMGISTATVKREWSHAKAWLHRNMKARNADVA